MPTYIYTCPFSPLNEQEFETVHSIAQELTECPKCQEAGREQHAPKRLIAATNFVLVGGGWASSGYSNK